MECQTLQKISQQLTPFNSLNLGDVDAYLDEYMIQAEDGEGYPNDIPFTNSMPTTPSQYDSPCPLFIAEYDYQMENGTTPDPLPSPALSFEQLLPQVDHEMKNDKAMPQSFTLFPKLPVEIRLQIWAMACQERRNVSIWFNTFVKPKLRYDFHPGNHLLDYRSNASDPEVLYVCREAREEALRHYSLYFGTTHTTSWFTFKSRPRVWCNLNVDTVCLTSNFFPRYTNSHYEDFFKKCATMKMPSLAYNIHQFFSYRGYTSGVNWSKIFRIVNAYGGRSSQLKEIVLYYDDNEDFTKQNNVKTEFVEIEWGAMAMDCKKVIALQDVQRDLLRDFPTKAEFVAREWNRKRALEIWGDIQNKVRFMDVKVSVGA